MNTDGTGFHTYKECHKTEYLWNHTTTDHKEGEQLEDRRSVGASSCNSGDGTDQRVQSFMFMMLSLAYQKPQFFFVHNFSLPLFAPIFIYILFSSTCVTVYWNWLQEQFCNLSLYTMYKGARGGAVVWGITLQARRTPVQFLIVLLEFFNDIILPDALRHWGWLSL